jgi:hypothetical protein
MELRPQIAQSEVGCAVRQRTLHESRNSRAIVLDGKQYHTRLETQTKNNRAGGGVSLDVVECFASHGLQCLNGLWCQGVLGPAQYQVGFQPGSLAEATNQPPQTGHEPHGLELRPIEGEDGFPQLFRSLVGKGQYRRSARTAGLCQIVA